MASDVSKANPGDSHSREAPSKGPVCLATSQEGCVIVEIMDSPSIHGGEKLNIAAFAIAAAARNSRTDTRSRKLRGNCAS